MIRKKVSSQQPELEPIIPDLHFNLITRKPLIISMANRVLPCLGNIVRKIRVGNDGHGVQSEYLKARIS